MRKCLIGIMLLFASILSATVAAAELDYILPYSDSRPLTYDEVDQWDYESLGYAFNEIFARHGYDFEPGGEYEAYFNTRAWYRPNGTYMNQRDCYSKLKRVEWDNYELIKAVRANKKHNDYGRSIWDSFTTGFDTLQGFEYVRLRADQTLPVYSAPQKNAWRGANGRAAVSTNGVIYAAGWESGWLLMMYETNSGSIRVGYVHSGSIRGGVPVDTTLHFEYDSARVLSRCVLTDDPAREGTKIATLTAGTQVTYLTRFYNDCAWDYVETNVNGKTARGFVRAGSLDIDRAADPLEDLTYGK